jgi:hypothetical protein
MHKELKKAIVNFILDNEKEFQLNNVATSKFRPYIYDSNGDYLFGGQDVIDFIVDAIELLKR